MEHDLVTRVQRGDERAFESHWTMYAFDPSEKHGKVLGAVDGRAMAEVTKLYNGGQQTTRTR
jgi:hypothetical protein